MCAALVKHGVDYTIIQWIRATLEGRMATATLCRFSRNIGGSRGCPQGGVLSPLLWCLVVDELIARLNGGGVYTQGYVDDICLRVVRKFPNMVSGLIQWVLHKKKRKNVNARVKNGFENVLFELFQQKWADSILTDLSCVQMLQRMQQKLLFLAAELQMVGSMCEKKTYHLWNSM